MPKLQIIKYLTLTLLTIFYLAYTIKYSITFSKSILFSKKLKLLHIFLFFLIPFIWIFVVQGFTKSTLGSYQFPNKVDTIPGSDVYIASDGA